MFLCAIAGTVVVRCVAEIVFCVLLMETPLLDVWQEQIFCVMEGAG